MRKLRRFKHANPRHPSQGFRAVEASAVALNRSTSAVGAYCDAQRLLAAAEQRAATLVEVEVKGARNRAYESARREAVRVIASASRFRERLLESDRNEALKIILEIVNEVLGEALEAQPATLNSRIRRAFEKVRISGACSIRVNPRDSEGVAAFIRSSDSEGTPSTSADIALIPDAGVQPGCARIESRSATIELDPWAHLKTVCERLDEVSRYSETRERETNLC